MIITYVYSGIFLSEPYSSALLLHVASLVGGILTRQCISHGGIHVLSHTIFLRRFMTRRSLFFATEIFFLGT